MAKLNPYMHFKGEARAAMEFYKAAFGGTVTVSTFKDAHMPIDAQEENWVMHSELTTEKGLTLMGSDTPSSMAYTPGTTVTISLSGEDEAELKGYWDKLSEGATVTQALEKAPWGDMFGMLTDKFGIEWMVNIAAPKA